MQFFLTAIMFKKSKPQELIPRASSEMWPISPEALFKVQQCIKPLSVRRELIARAETMFCGEIFRFLAAIVDWEEISDTYAAFSMLLYH